MQIVEFNKQFKLDEKRLLQYLERIKKQFSSLNQIQLVRKFLENQSIGSLFNIESVLSYYEDKLREEKTIVEFAFEWIRANEIHLEYKRHLSITQFTNYNSAIDDCIFYFFLPYDNYIRRLFIEDTQEHEISTLYEVFFNTGGTTQKVSFTSILKKHKLIVPTLYQNEERINTNIITIRAGVGPIIKNDYEALVESLSISKGKESKMKALIKEDNNKKLEKKEFKGLQLINLVKAFKISKDEFSPREVERAIGQFLSSYFEFGVLYSHNDFIELLVRRLSEDINYACPNDVKQHYTVEKLSKMITDELYEFNEENSSKKLDGIAWKNDLLPILSNLLTRFLLNLKKLQ